MGAAGLSEKEVLVQEKEVLKEKLLVNLGMWAVEKRFLEENLSLARREYEGKNVVQAFEIASANLSYGCQQKESLLAKLKLEGALDDLEELQSRVLVLNLLLEERQDELDVASKRYSEMEAWINLQNIEATKATQDMDSIRKEAERARYLQHNLDNLQKKYNSEIDKLKSDQHKASSKHEQEMLCLMRERNFVWDQLKRMEDDYMKSLQSKGVQFEASEKENTKLKLLLEGMRKGQNNNVVNLALINRTGQESNVGSDPDINSLQVATSVSAPLANATIVAVEGEGLLEQNDAISSDMPVTCVHYEIKEENISAEREGMKLENFENRNKTDGSFLQADGTMSLVITANEEELKKASKTIDDLRLENQNLRTIYADLERQLKDRQQRPERGHITTQATATRNLNAELDAVAEQNAVDAELEEGNQLQPRKSKSVDDSASLRKAISKWKFENNNLSQKGSERTEVASLSPSPRLANVRKGWLRNHAGPPSLGSHENGTVKKEDWKNCSEDGCTPKVNMRQQFDQVHESQTSGNSQKILFADNTYNQSQKGEPRQLNKKKSAEGSKVQKIDKAVPPAVCSSLQQRKRHFFSSYFSIPKVQRMVSSSNTR